MNWHDLAMCALFLLIFHWGRESGRDDERERSEREKSERSKTKE